MKKRLSIFLIFVLLFSLSSTTVASALTNKSELPGLYAAEDGDMFILQSEDRDATIITNDTHHSMTVSIKYSHNPDTVYQWYISDYPMPFEPSSSAFWTDIIAYAEDHISQAEEIIFVSNTPSEMHNSIQPFSSAGADIYPQLVKYVGTSPFEDIIRYSTTMDGNTVRVYEDMRFEVRFSQNKSWSTAVFVSTLITSVLGLIVTNTIVQAICTAFNVVVSVYASIAAGSMNCYTCTAIFSRYVNVNSSEYPYNMTIRTVSYEAYEDASPSSTRRAEIDSGSRTTSYNKSESYYQNCYAQALDGYNVYKSVGPRS